jgi:hypothetical protein
MSTIGTSTERLSVFGYYITVWEQYQHKSRLIWRFFAAKPKEIVTIHKNTKSSHNLAADLVK